MAVQTSRLLPMQQVEQVHGVGLPHGLLQPVQPFNQCP